MPVAPRRLGRTGWTVSELSLSCAEPWSGRWMDEASAVALIRQAVKLGITGFHTGPAYAAARAQERLGKALRTLGPERDGLLISTCVGTVRLGRSHVARDFSPDTVEQQVAESLDRLGLDRLPLVCLDRPEMAYLSDDLLDTLAALKGEGAADLIGIAGTPQQIAAGRAAARGTGLIDVIMPSYSPADQDSETAIEHAARDGLGVIATGTLARLSFAPLDADWSLPRTWWQARRRLADRLVASHHVGRAQRCRFLTAVPGWTAAQACLGFVLSHPDVHSAAFATADLRHLHENAEASGRDLPVEVIRRIVAAHG
ncbi:aldo/keto reductase [Thalassobaculum sp. OXR-137]|uniref:aldo/keto reductase n=1 Tax=Thalassobaculum sp. OXR-137 TaxID=3100173 RepID=UPI002AC99EB5|nr:aldo/keto reductase [Thalassobaculum sp. OXR-137]WPZ34841.1 aldo/keto reductase [Thalassobaculum sp. OXR-137]